MAVINVTVDPTYGPYYTLGEGISGVLSSGITSDDMGVVNIFSGVYNESPEINSPSGDFYIVGNNNVQIDGMILTNSGDFKCENVGVTTFTSTGSGNIDFIHGSVTDFNVYNSPSVSIQESVVTSGFYSVGSDYVQFITVDSSGTLSASGGYTLSILSGNYPSAVFNVTDYVSGVIFDHSRGVNTIINMVDSSGFILNHTSFASINGSGILFAENSSGVIEYSILAASGAEPVSGVSSSITATGTCVFDYANPAESHPSVGGQYINRDPIFVNIGSGDLRINANSPCASSADYLENALNIDGDIINTTLDQNAIKFYVEGEEYLAKRPSGVYIVQDGKSVYFAAEGRLDNNMDVLVHNQFNIAGEVEGQQSLSSDKDVTHPYPADYKIIERKNYATNQTESYVQPYTILSLHDMLMTIDDEVADVVVSGFFFNRGFSREHSPEADGTSRYWIAEGTNNILRKYSANDDTLIDKYILFPYNPSGSFKTVKVGENFHPLIQTKLDPNKDVRAILDYKDWLYVLVKERSETEDTVSYATNLHVFNKFERFPFVDPVSIVSGVPSIIDNNATDMTIDDEGSLYISSSGQINKYVQKFDYALVTRQRGTTKTNITFRELYESVDL